MFKTLVKYIGEFKRDAILTPVLVVMEVIMVLDHGRIVERGNHDSLLRKKGLYYQLYTGKLEQE